MTHLGHVAAQFLDLGGRAFDEHLPATTGLFAHALQPGRIQLITTIGFDEFAAVDTSLVGQFHHSRVNRHDAAVDAVQLVDQRLDPVVVQVQLIDQQHDFRTQLLIRVLFLGRETVIFVQGGGHAQVLHFAQQHIVARDQLQLFQYTGFQRRFHRGQRHVGLFVFVVVVIFLGNRVAVGVQLGAGLFLVVRRGGAIGGRCGGGRRPVDHVFTFVVILTHLGTKGGIQVDNVAQQNVFGQKFVTPDGDGLEGQRAFAKPRDHRIAPGLDPFGNRDFAFARQQLDRAHFAQIHAHGVIGAVQLFGLGRRNRDITYASRGCHSGRALVFVLGLFVLDDVDAHFGQHGHHVFDLFRADLIRRQDLVQLVIGDVPFFPRLCDHLLDRSLADIDHRFVVLVVFAVCSGVLGGHAALLGCVRSWGCVRPWVRITDSNFRIIHVIE